MPIFSNIIQYNFVILTTAIREKKSNKRNPEWKRISKILTTDNMILYTENLKDATRKLLINKYRKISIYKINTQKPLSFLYINNEKSEREIKKAIPLNYITRI